MTLKQRALNLIAKLVLELPASRAGIAAYADKLQTGGEDIIAQFQALGRDPSPHAIATLRHISTIERWGQNRLKGFLGQPVDLTDDSKTYAPPKGDAIGMITAFRDTRAKTVELARQLSNGTPPKVETIPHNEFGPLTVGGWLQYLYFHASRETRKFKK